METYGRRGDELEDELLDELAEAAEPKALEAIEEIARHISDALYIDGCAHWLVGQYLERGLRAWANDYAAWKDWMREKWGFGYRQAHRYMNIYHQFPSGPPTAEQAIEAMREQQGRSPDKAKAKHLDLSGPRFPEKLQQDLGKRVHRSVGRLMRDVMEVDRWAGLYPETGWPIYLRTKLKDHRKAVDAFIEGQENAGWRQEPSHNGTEPGATLAQVVDAVKPLYPKNRHGRIEKLASQLDLSAMGLDEAIRQMLTVMTGER